MKSIRRYAILLLMILSLLVSSCNFDTVSIPEIITDIVDVEERTLPDERELTFVSINDLHGYIEQDSAGKGGIANTAYAIDGLSRYFGDNDDKTDTRDDVILFANGDMFQGTGVSNMTNGNAVIAAMNEMRFDGMGIGNHEFDWGIDTILAYFDGDEGNGEADFPLLSANVYRMSASNYISDISDTDSLVSSVTVEKEGVKVGLISAIGPCRDSILQTQVADYFFADVVSSVQREAEKLHSSGAELISVNIHYGKDRGILYYDDNLKIANLKAEDGSYLVDVIFNGHTHTMQSGCISRQDGTDVPVVQGGGYNEAIAYAKLTYNVKTGETSLGQYGYKTVDSVGTKADEKVEQIVETYSEDYLITQPILAEAGVSLSYKSELYSYLGDLMVSAFDSDYAIYNTGGVRGTGGIIKGKAIYESNLYEIIPFDNEFYYITVPGSALYDLYQKYPPNGILFYGQSSDAPDIGSLKNSTAVYSVAIVDYVYTGRYYTAFRSKATSEINTHLLLRNLFAEDLKLCNKLHIPWNPEDGARLKKQIP